MLGLAHLCRSSVSLGAKPRTRAVQDIATFIAMRMFRASMPDFRRRSIFFSANFLRCFSVNSFPGWGVGSLCALRSLARPYRTSEEPLHIYDHAN